MPGVGRRLFLTWHPYLAEHSRRLYEGLASGRADPQAAKGAEARIAHEISLYYVAATRARNGLVIYEENVDFWRQDEFESLLVPSSEPGILGAYWARVSSQDEWRSAALAARPWSSRDGARSIAPSTATSPSATSRPRWNSSPGPAATTTPTFSWPNTRPTRNSPNSWTGEGPETQS